jgi:hypothetical protein
VCVDRLEIHLPGLLASNTEPSRRVSCSVGSQFFKYLWECDAFSHRVQSPSSWSAAGPITMYITTSQACRASYSVVPVLLTAEHEAANRRFSSPLAFLNVCPFALTWVGNGALVLIRERLRMAGLVEGRSAQSGFEGVG